MFRPLLRLFVLVFEVIIDATMNQASSAHFEERADSLFNGAPLSGRDAGDGGKRAVIIGQRKPGFVIVPDQAHIRAVLGHGQVHRVGVVRVNVEGEPGHD